MLFNIPMPANVLYVNDVIFEIATFDIIPLDWLVEYHDEVVGDLDNEHELFLSTQAQDKGYDKTNPISNLILPLFLVSITLLSVLILKLTSYCGQAANKLYLKVKKQLKWNAAFRLFNEEFITISLACLVKLYTLDFTNLYEAFISLFAILVLISTILTPILVTKWLWKMHAKGHLRLLE